MSRVVIIGGGICGLSCAWYLARDGWQVTVLDKGDFTESCSYGNAGFVCPSHYIQLSTPGIVKQGFKWLLNPSSPFYIQPRLDKKLLQWGWQFIRAATKENVRKNGPSLRDIGLLSQHEYEQVWQKEMDFSYERKGMLEIFQTPAGEAECHPVVDFGKRLGLDIDLVDARALKELEPYVALNARGAIYYKCDAHLNPQGLMRSLLAAVNKQGVQLIKNAEVTDTVIKHKQLQSVITQNEVWEAEAFVLAAGAWSGELARKLKLTLPLVGGRGYSVTIPVKNEQMRLEHPGILLEGRCAVTPLGNQLRLGGTMEITSLTTPPRYRRVKGILRAVHNFFPGIGIPLEEVQDDVWCGFRPVSGDGLPYIGKTKHYENLLIATGHSQLGISLGPATGRLVKEVLSGEKTMVDITAFAADRFE